MRRKTNMGSFVLRFGLSVLLCCVVACSRVRSRGPVPVLESILIWKGPATKSSAASESK